MISIFITTIVVNVINVQDISVIIINYTSIAQSIVWIKLRDR